jgi:hypothetical protein
VEWAKLAPSDLPLTGANLVIQAVLVEPAATVRLAALVALAAASQLQRALRYRWEIFRARVVMADKAATAVLAVSAEMVLTVPVETASMTTTMVALAVLVDWAEMVAQVVPVVQPVQSH